MDQRLASRREQYRLTEAEREISLKCAEPANRGGTGVRQRRLLDFPSASLNNAPELSTAKLHEPLSGANCIRLLSLSTQEHSDRIECSLDEACLDRKEERDFTALSYAWHETAVQSKPDEKRTIIINGRDVKISANLFAALSRIFADGPDTRLWVDALCINQADVAERNEQVSLMSSIYGQAEKVIAWLGEFPSSGLQSVLKAWSLIEYARNKPSQHNLVKELGFFTDTTDDGLFPALDGIFGRQWFNRSWTYQEIMLASAGEVRLGSLKTPWQDFAAGCQWLGQELGPDEWLKGNHQALWPGFPHGPPQPSTLSRLLVNVSGRAATEPRDKVFSVLGLLTEPTIQVDYSATVVQTFTEAVRHCITKEHDLAMLELAIFQADWWRCQTHADRHQWLERMEGLPTWVPDLAHTPSLQFKPKRNDSWKVKEPLNHFYYHIPGLILLQGVVIARWTSTMQQDLILSPTPMCARSGHVIASDIVEEFSRHDQLVCSCWVASDGGLAMCPDGNWIHVLDPPYRASMAQCRSEVMEGDWLCVFDGAACPYVIRPQKVKGNVWAFQLIGVIRTLSSPVIGAYEWNLSELAPDGLTMCFTQWEKPKGFSPCDSVEILLV